MWCSVECEGRVPFTGLVGPQAGKSMGMVFDPDEPFGYMKVQCVEENLLTCN